MKIAMGTVIASQYASVGTRLFQRHRQEKSMIRKSIVLFAVIAALLYGAALCATPAHAQVTLADLLNGGSLIVFDKQFSNFREYSSIVSGGAIAANPANIDATALNDDPLNPGILWEGGHVGITIIGGPPAEAEAGEWDVNAGGTQRTRFLYDVSTLSGAKLIKDNTLTLGFSGIFEPGEVRINESVSFGPNGVILGRKEVFFRSDDLKLEDHIEFAPQNLITVETIITLDSHGTGAAALASFAQRFSQLDVPEPGTWALLLAGGLPLAALVRRSRRGSV
jgi:hypothetical protein